MPGVEQFARDNSDVLTVIGLGAQDSYSEAVDFLDRFGGADITMLWDASFESWAELGIRGQPAGMLFTADGTAVAGWSGGLPEEELLAAVADLG